jgi:hypothetical protein
MTGRKIEVALIASLSLRSAIAKIKIYCHRVASDKGRSPHPPTLTASASSKENVQKNDGFKLFVPYAPCNNRREEKKEHAYKNNYPVHFAPSRSQLLRPRLTFVYAFATTLIARRTTLFMAASKTFYLKCAWRVINELQIKIWKREGRSKEFFKVYPDETTRVACLLNLGCFKTVHYSCRLAACAAK